MNKINMIENFYNGNILTKAEIDFYNNANTAGDVIGGEIKQMIKKLYNLSKQPKTVKKNQILNVNRIIPG